MLTNKYEMNELLTYFTRNVLQLVIKKVCVSYA